MNLLHKLNPADFDQLYRLMELSFPVDEHRPYEGQKALLSHPAYQIYAVSDEANQAVHAPGAQAKELQAFVAVWDFTSFFFIEHFAVHPDYRNLGLGSRILQELQQMLPQMLCLEVELPNTELAARRIGFYERNHFFYNSYPYMQPALAAGQNTLPLQIMTSGQTISQEEFLNMKEILYTQVYNLTKEQFL